MDARTDATDGEWLGGSAARIEARVRCRTGRCADARVDVAIAFDERDD